MREVATKEVPQAIAELGSISPPEMVGAFDHTQFGYSRETSANFAQSLGRVRLICMTLSSPISSKHRASSGILIRFFPPTLMSLSKATYWTI